MLSRSLARLTGSARRMSGIAAAVRHDWTRDEIGAIYRLPFTELLHQASTVHRQHFDPLEVQRCTLLSIKTGGCNEDCKYCAQSTRYKTFVKPEPLMSVDAVKEAARRAKAAGSTRFCMGTAWRELGNKKGAFGKILKMVEEVNGMGLEVCCTLGMLSEEQVKLALGRAASISRTSLCSVRLRRSRDRSVALLARRLATSRRQASPPTTTTWTPRESTILM